jgi:DNA-binding MarR family transcriptional regulator
MSELTKLVSAWENFSQTRTRATVTEFCRHYLAKDKTEPDRKDLFEGMTPPDLYTTLAKLIGRVAAVHNAYSKIALRELNGKIELEWFYFMNAIYHRKEMRKSDVINFNFYEQSTGTDILNRISKAGYLLEKDDPMDKRAKLVSLSKKGETLLMKVYELMHLPGLLLFYGMSEADKQLLVSILGEIEIKHATLLPAARDASIHQLCEDDIGKEEMKTVYGEIKEMVRNFKK